MSKQSTAKARAWSDRRAPITSSMRFHGRARFVLDIEALSRTLTTRLRKAARRDMITEDRVRDYCAARAIPHHRFETALLSEAFKMVSTDQLIDRLVAHVRSRVDPTLIRSYVCGGDDRSWAQSPGHAAATGSLSIEGSLRASGGRSFRIDIGWDVEKGTPCESFGAAAGAHFAQPTRALIACIAADALARLSDELPVRIATGFADAGDPTFVNVERLLRLGRLTHTTRVYLLYWKRLRDFLIWSITG